MKFVPLLVSISLTVLLIVVFNTRFGLAPAFGQFLSPQHGFWQNAEAVDKDFNQDLRLPGLKDPAEIYLDDRLVPHVFAANEIDAFYIQGYLHARFRLWQMEFQTYAAGGRISELVGPRATSYDREKRRLGMVYSAEKTVAEMEKDPETKAQLDAYTAGVNEYINHLTESELPLEYKLLGYQPELWTNLKTALLMKYMSLDLSGAEDDFEFTNEDNTATELFAGFLVLLFEFPAPSLSENLVGALVKSYPGSEKMIDAVTKQLFSLGYHDQFATRIFMRD